MSIANTPALDAITLEILLNSLRSVADETYIALMRSAYSTNIKERNDHSTALIDPKGRLIALCEFAQPIHLSSMLGLTTRMLETWSPGDFRPGDIFIGNDPYASGGSHLPDINMSMPLFAGDVLLGFMCTIAHHADVGGMAPGSMSGGTEIYQEGLRIPPSASSMAGACARISSTSSCSMCACPRNGAATITRRSPPVALATAASWNWPRRRGPTRCWPPSTPLSSAPAPASPARRRNCLPETIASPM
jgi:N-methylhydantoinase B/oxoprolinase/acetone carboxylase alpha subunit